MNRLLPFITFMLFSLLGLSQQVVQQDFNAGGGVISNSQIDVSFSIGQPIFDTYQGTFSNFFNGFQQGGGAFPIGVQTDSVNCNGENSGSATVFIFGGVQNHTVSWSDGQSGLTDTALLAGNYSVTVTDALGYQSDTTFEIFQPAVLTLNSIYPNGEQFVCALEQYQFGVSVIGGTAPYTYDWGSPPNMLNPNSANPIVTSLDTFLYSPVVTDFHGCQATTQYILSYDNPVVRGKILYNGIPVGAGQVEVYLFPVSYTLGSLENLDTINNNYPDSCYTDANGEYTLVGNVFSEKYLILARPRDSVDQAILPNAVNTYYTVTPNTEAFMWQRADSVGAICGDTINNISIELLITPEIQGPGVLSGYIRWGVDKTQTNNDPIPLIDVVVEKDSIPLRYTVTDSNGYYEFDNMPADTCYKIYINYCGLNMFGNGNHCITQNDTVLTNINFWVDTIGGNGSDLGPGIYTVQPTAIEENPDILNDWVNLFPNPTEDVMLLQIKNASKRPANIRILNISGQEVFNRQKFDKDEFYLSEEYFSSGMYLIEIERNGNSYHNKIVFK